jgi:hypothetical protein
LPTVRGRRLSLTIPCSLAEILNWTRSCEHEINVLPSAVGEGRWLLESKRQENHVHPSLTHFDAGRGFQGITRRNDAPNFQAVKVNCISPKSFVKLSSRAVD